MKITYSVTFDDFRSLNASAVPPRRPKPALYGIMAFGGLLSLAGVLITLKALEILNSRPIPEGTVGQGVGAITAGAVVIACCVLYERYLDSKLRSTFEQMLLLKFKQLHCRDKRSVELTPDGMQTACGCHTSNYSWSDITAFVDDGKFLRVRTGKDLLTLPHRIFSNAAEKEDFVSLITQELKRTSRSTGIRVQFSYTKGDFRNAKLLHISKGMNWKTKLQTSGALLLLGGLACSVPWLAARSYHLALGVALTLAGFFLVVFRRMNAQRYYGPWNALVSWYGIQLQDGSGAKNENWSDFKGYVESRAYWLLYYKNNRYRIFPKRAFQQNQAIEFTQIVSSNIPPMPTW